MNAYPFASRSPAFAPLGASIHPNVPPLRLTVPPLTFSFPIFPTVEFTVSVPPDTLITVRLSAPAPFSSVRFSVPALMLSVVVVSELLPPATVNPFRSSVTVAPPAMFKLLALGKSGTPLELIAHIKASRSSVTVYVPFSSLPAAFSASASPT